MLWDNREGWTGVGGRREVQEEGSICIHIADSCCRMVEIRIML